MITHVSRDTPFLADITATVDGKPDHRLVVEQDGKAALYIAAQDAFEMPYWEPVDHDERIVASIISDLARAASVEDRQFAKERV